VIIARVIEKTACRDTTLNSKNDVTGYKSWILNFKNGVLTLLKILK